MWGYQRNPNWGWEDAAAEGLAGLITVGCIATAAVAVTIAIVIIREIGRIYLERVVRGRSETASILWANLAALLFLLLVAGLLGANPDTASAAVILACSAWTMFCLVTEGCDIYESRFDVPKQEALGDLDTYLDLGPIPQDLHANGSNGAKNGKEAAAVLR